LENLKILEKHGNTRSLEKMADNKIEEGDKGMLRSISYFPSIREKNSGFQYLNASRFTQKHSPHKHHVSYANLALGEVWTTCSPSLLTLKALLKRQMECLEVQKNCLLCRVGG